MDKAQITNASSFIPIGVLQRKCATCGNHAMAGSECAACKEKSEGMLQRAAINPSPVHEVPPIVHEVLRSPGQPLDVMTRAFMESRFGHDFSGVRVHTDTRAAESAGAVNALAYTIGHKVVFAAGQYAPSTHDGRELLAHELTHTLQQRASFRSDQSISLPSTRIAPSDGQAETEAENISKSRSIGLKPLVSAPAITLSEPIVQRQHRRRPNPRRTRASRIDRFLEPGTSIWRQLNPNEHAYANCPATAAAVDEFLSTGRIRPAPPGQAGSEFIVTTGSFSPNIADFQIIMDRLRDRRNSFVVIRGIRPPEYADSHHVTPDHFFVVVHRAGREPFVIDAFGEGRIHSNVEEYIRIQGFSEYQYFRGAFRVVERLPPTIPDLEAEPPGLGEF
jgi:hypothetical protein